MGHWGDERGFAEKADPANENLIGDEVVAGSRQLKTGYGQDYGGRRRRSGGYTKKKKHKINVKAKTGHDIECPHGEERKCEATDCWCEKEELLSWLHIFLFVVLIIAFLFISVFFVLESCTKHGFS